MRHNITLGASPGQRRPQTGTNVASGCGGERHEQGEQDREHGRDTDQGTFREYPGLMFDMFQS